jgi:hypothetical protein
VLGTSLLALAGGGVAAETSVKECGDRTPAATMAEVRATIELCAGKYGAENILVVFDIDNTLLKMSQDLGSDAWYNWQKDLIEYDPSSRYRIPSNKNELLRLQGRLYQLYDMEPPEQGAPAMLKELVSSYSVMALTARNPDTRKATMRELADAGYVFTTAPACGKDLCSTPGNISAETLEAASVRAANCFPTYPGLKSLRSISYADGVMMASGLDKGAILQILLASTTDDCAVKGSNYKERGRYKAIVFIDDGDHNVVDVSRAFERDGDWVAVRDYTNLDSDVTKFNMKLDRKNAVEARWQTLQRELCAQSGEYCPTSLTLMSWNLENFFDTADDPANPYDNTYRPLADKNNDPQHAANCDTLYSDDTQAKCRAVRDPATPSYKLECKPWIGPRRNLMRKFKLLQAFCGTLRLPRT